MNAVYQQPTGGNAAGEIKLCQGANGHRPGGAQQVHQPAFKPFPLALATPEQFHDAF